MCMVPVLVHDFKYISLKLYILLQRSHHEVYAFSWTAILQLAVQKRNKAGKTVTFMQSSVHVA